MNEEFKYLLLEITATESDKWGAMIRLINDEHIDYIEDVFAEHFDMDYDFKVMNENTKEFILYFNDKANIIRQSRTFTLLFWLPLTYNVIPLNKPSMETYL